MRPRQGAARKGAAGDRGTAQGWANYAWAMVGAALAMGAIALSLRLPAGDDAPLLERLDWMHRVAVWLTVLIGSIACGALGLLAIGGTIARRRAAAARLAAMAETIDHQGRLIQTLFDAMEDPAGVKRPDDGYVWVNDALAAAAGQPREQLNGSTDEMIFGPELAHRLLAADAEAERSAGAVRLPPQEVTLNGRPRQLQFSKVAVRASTGEVEAILTIGRDLSEQVEQRRRQEAGLRQAVEALAHTIEHSDPHLAGHSRFLGGFSRLVAQTLGLDRHEMETLELASNLSQLGKLFVPRDLLRKPARLTADELYRVRRHVDFAATLLRDIDFGLPVQSALAQMTERLDGSGYPAGLAGEQIGQLGRVLGVCDAFTARIRPRAHRLALPAERALEALANHPEWFDAAVVAALATAVKTREGRRLLADIAEEAATAA